MKGLFFPPEITTGQADFQLKWPNFTKMYNCTLQPTQTIRINSYGTEQLTCTQTALLPNCLFLRDPLGPTQLYLPVSGSTFVLWCIIHFLLYRHNYRKLNLNKAFFWTHLITVLPSSNILFFCFFHIVFFFCPGTIKWTEMMLLSTRTFSGHQRLAQRAPRFDLKQKATRYDRPVTFWGAALWPHDHLVLSDWNLSPALLRAGQAPSSHLMPHTVPSLSASQPSLQPALLGSQVSPRVIQPDTNHSCKASVAFSLFISPNLWGLVPS